MRKTIYPASLLYCTTMLFFSAITIISLYAIMLCAYKMYLLKALVLIIPVLAALNGAMLFGYIVICNIPNRMILTDKCITVTGQKMKSKIQHRETVDLAEIRNIRMILAHIDSKGKPLKVEGIASMRSHVFFEFELQNNTSKLVYIEIYSVRQRKKIIDFINDAANLNLSYGNLERSDQSIFRKRK